MSVLEPLEEIVKYLEDGESVPLAWVVAHGSDFRSIWDSCEDPQVMLTIAAYTLPRRDFALAMVAVAKTVLKYIPVSEKRPRAAVKAIVDWTNGKVSAGDVSLAANRVYTAQQNAVPSSANSSAILSIARSARAVTAPHARPAARFAVNAAEDATHAHTTAAMRDVGSARVFVHRPVYVHKPQEKELAFHRLGRLVRSKLRGKVTLAKIIEAAREASR